jgi:serine/threonine-protein kinase RsbW
MNAQPHPDGATPVSVRRWPNNRRCVGRARRDLRDVLTAWGLEELTDSAELVLSELVTNAVRHARSPLGRHIETRYERADGGVRIEVHDANERWPELQKADAEAEAGRGLMLVDVITGQRWGASEREGVGKLVWAVVTASGPGQWPYLAE